MESNLMSCPTCGHSVSNAAGACAYCGAFMSEGEQNQLTDDKIVAEEARATESEAPLQQEEAPPAAEMSDEVNGIPATDKELSDSDRSKQPPEVAATADASEMETEAVLVTDNEAESAVGEVESISPVYEQKVESEPEFSRQLPDVDDDSEITSTEAVVLESFPQAGAGPAFELKPDANEPESETIPPPEKPELATQEEIQTESVAEPELISEVSEDTILLDISDEIELPPADLIAETAKMESPASASETEIKPIDLSAETQQVSADIFKIEEAARDMAAAIEKQKASVLEAKNAKKTTEAKAQALKKQKADLAKARAQKKQKLILAKAAALKRKKAAQAKAQALKRQKADQVAIEPAIMEEVAATKVNREDSQPTVNRGTKASNKMQGLLEKYRGQAIGINYDNSAEIKEAQLVEANGDFFSVFVDDQKLHYSYPLKTILTVIEGQDGVDTGDSKQQDKFNVVIKVYPLVHI